MVLLISINILTDDNKESKILGTDFAGIVIYVSNSKSTGIKSSNESPIIRPYYKIEISTGEEIFNYYVYEHNNKVYIECPYEEVYTIDSQVVNLISK